MPRKTRWMPDSRIPAAAEPRIGDVFGVVVDRDQLSRGFQRLSTDHRAVIVLRYLVDLSPEQVAEALGIPRKTVYSRLGRAVDALAPRSRPTTGSRTRCRSLRSPPHER